ncbi:MAG: AbrB family transcriptional regulator, partial [Bacilli bacterium]
LVFAMLSTAFLNCTTRHAYMPLTIKTGAQIFAGALVGCTLTRETIINFQKLVLPVFLLITSYLLVNLIFSLICKKKKYLDMKSALFASCPAGVSDMALIAGDLGGDMAKTALIQVVRLVFVIACMPTLSQIFVNVFYK